MDLLTWYMQEIEMIDNDQERALICIWNLKKLLEYYEESIQNSTWPL